MESRTYLAFDFGERRIGVAVGNDLTESANALLTIDAGTDELRFKAITPLVDEWTPYAFVVGHPTHASGDAHAMTARAERFARQLQGRFRRIAHLVDERYSSVDAVQALGRSKASGQQKKQAIDSEAAAVILRRFFESGMHHNITKPELS
ncbi:MAG: Holliday junction resolvase RuvX [Betaproteobacteria bacterium]|nr:MAG: Holliday junction resolvase RuvX [Betaproteobacteria bacterium]